jgi:hypothetical protein
MAFFSDGTKANSMSHIKQLEDNFVLRGVLMQLQLAIALRSLTVPAARSRTSAIQHDLNDYNPSKAAFI